MSIITRAIASGSKGNCYHVTDGDTPLLLECGIRFKDIQEALSFRTSELAGCLVSHEHKDHCLAAHDLSKRGVDVLMSAGTIKSLFTKDNLHFRTHTIRANEQFRLGSWIILPFEAIHDAAEPLCFLLYSDRTKEKLLFATDTAYIKYRFNGLTHIMIECNHDMEVMRDNVSSGKIHYGHKRRVMHNHMSLSTVLNFLRTNDLSALKEIYLLHMSDDNSNMQNMMQKVSEITNTIVYAP